MVHFSFSEVKPKGRNSTFPDFSFQNTLTKEENRYLGSSQKHMLSFRKIRGDIFIIEVFSTYCMACPKNVPVLNAVYSAVTNNTDLKDKVKIVGIAVGNTENEIKAYRKSYGMHYPVLSDYHFTFLKVIGNPRVPYTIFIKRLPGGNKDVIFYTHQGVLDSPESILRAIQDEFHEKK
jgi:thiol-disulfide isomerase/thioredoxin